MGKWLQGFKEFRDIAFHQKKELFEALAGGQQPEAMMIACADSRVNPNLITQTEPGDLFVVRNAGNFVPPVDAGPHAAGAAIELAIVEFGIHDLIVCGHSNCGAIKLMLSPDILCELPAMTEWLSYAGDTLNRTRTKYPDATGEEFLERAIEQNVLVQIEHAMTHPSVKAAVEAGRLLLHGIVYQIDTGEVLHYDAKEDAFLPI